MMKMHILVLVAMAAGLTVGCGPEKVAQRFAGTFIAHVGSSDSVTSNRADLTPRGRLVAGFDYGDANETDWTATIDWSLLASKTSSDRYQLTWKFVPESGPSVSGISSILYDGKNQAVVRVNEQLSITIDPISTDSGG
jgi:hypothetical protein